jgi:hypothetical protein
VPRVPSDLLLGQIGDRMNWRFLVCTCGSPMLKLYPSYNFWTCPVCHRVDSWGEESTVILVASGDSVEYNGQTFVCYPVPGSDYQHTVEFPRVPGPTHVSDYRIQLAELKKKLEGL